MGTIRIPLFKRPRPKDEELLTNLEVQEFGVPVDKITRKDVSKMGNSRFARYMRIFSTKNALHSAETASDESVEHRYLRTSPEERKQLKETSPKEIKKSLDRRSFLRYGAGFAGIAALAAIGTHQIDEVMAIPAPSILPTLEPSAQLPMTYMIYSDPSGPTYLARNGVTGRNDYKETVFATLLGTDVFANLTQGSWILVRANGSAGYPMGNALSPALNLGGVGGWVLTGEPYGNNQNSLTRFGTRFMASAANQTMFQGSAGKNALMQAWGMENFVFDANGFTGVVGCDMTTSSEGSTGGSFMRNISANADNAADSAQNGQFNYVLILDGQDDILLDNFQTRGASLVTSASALADIHWDVPAGTVALFHPVSLSVRSLIGKWQAAYIGGGMGTIDCIQLDGSGLQPYLGQTTIRDIYWGNIGGLAASQPDKFDVNGFTHECLEIDGATVRVNNSKNLVHCGAGFLNQFIARNAVLVNYDGTANVTDSLTNFGRYRRIVDAVKMCSNTGTSSPYSNNPWNIDGNLYLYNPMSANAPGNPAGTSSLVAVMAGLGILYTPKETGSLLILVSGVGANNTGGDAGQAQISYGTGAAPVNGAALTGTQAGGIAIVTSPTGAQKFSWSTMAFFVTPGNPFVIGTQYWFDLAFAAITGGTYTLTNLNYEIRELRN